MAEQGLKYTESHEWAKIEGNIATIGLTDFAIEHLGDIVYLELPEAGDDVTAGTAFGTVESVKAASDLNSPLSGKVTEINEELPDNLETLQNSPFAGGWLVKIELSDASEASKLMDCDVYEEYLKNQD
ncbi:MAG: glycine cleavage system protein GcvH [Phycisphaerae bacterium]|nr:glycine cleavage system protein GcvH [Phycisphaerae bacterium]